MTEISIQEQNAKALARVEKQIISMANYFKHSPWFLAHFVPRPLDAFHYFKHSPWFLAHFGRFRLTLWLVVGGALAAVGDNGREFACNFKGNFPRWMERLERGGLLKHRSLLTCIIC
jgi:hypothetical protein